MCIIGYVSGSVTTCRRCSSSRFFFFFESKKKKDYLRFPRNDVPAKPIMTMRSFVPRVLAARRRRIDNTIFCFFVDYIFILFRSLPIVCECVRVCVYTNRATDRAHPLPLNPSPTYYRNEWWWLPCNECGGGGATCLDQSSSSS